MKADAHIVFRINSELKAEFEAVLQANEENAANVLRDYVVQYTKNKKRTTHLQEIEVFQTKLIELENDVSEIKKELLGKLSA